jgi:hypothetical protein
MTPLQHGGRSLAGGAAARRALAVFPLVMATSSRGHHQPARVDVGFTADRILAFDVPQPSSCYSDARASQEFANRLLPRISTLPESSAASVPCDRSGRRRHGLVCDDEASPTDGRRIR